MRLRRGMGAVLAMLLPGLALALWLGLGAGFLLMALDGTARDALVGALAPVAESHGMVLVLWWVLFSAGAGLLARRFYAAHVEAPERLADAARVAAGDPAAPAVPEAGPAGLRALAEAVNDLAGQRRALQDDMARLVAEASRDVAFQRDQLAALMAELEQSVVVLNLDGRILLYNARARTLFRHLFRTPGNGAGGTGDGVGADPIGLGRSIHTVIDRALMDHARETVERLMGRGEARPSARFVTTTPLGHLVRVLLAPVRAETGGAVTGQQITGFVLLLDDITDEYEARARQDRTLIDLSESARASLAAMQAALDMLDYPDLDAPDRERFQAVVRDEVMGLGTRLSLAADTAGDMGARWPLQDMLGADLAAAAARRITADTGHPVATGDVDADIWLSVDSFALIGALAFLAARVAEAEGGADPAFALRLAPAGGRVHLDLAFADAHAAAGGAGWQTQPMGGAAQLCVRDVVERHGGELWLERARTGSGACFRFLLPAASEGHAEAPAAAESRPAYFDFDLFAASAGSHASDERALSDLAYTVFDTETTGLDPAGGDEILQIGATRIVNGRILSSECFDQLVDPGRTIPEAGIAVHGIRPEMVRGKPSIARVLPAFHAFAADTVLVGHNVAFDMRFLTLKEEASGVAFDQPVLDTLLLAGLAHPGEESHGLEAIAGRLGVTVAGRHTALGDALVTAEIFLKLLPLLRARGIRTLGEARAAAATSYYAKLKY